MVPMPMCGPILLCSRVLIRFRCAGHPWSCRCLCLSSMGVMTWPRSAGCSCRCLRPSMGAVSAKISSCSSGCPCPFPLTTSVFGCNGWRDLFWYYRISTTVRMTLLTCLGYRDSAPRFKVPVAMSMPIACSMSIRFAHAAQHVHVQGWVTTSSASVLSL